MKDFTRGWAKLQKGGVAKKEAGSDIKMGRTPLPTMFWWHYGLSVTNFKSPDFLQHV